jgi:hypothetical protein
MAALNPFNDGRTLSSSSGTTLREAHNSFGATNSWRAWEAIGRGEGDRDSLKSESPAES